MSREDGECCGSCDDGTCATRVYPVEKQKLLESLQGNEESKKAETKKDHAHKVCCDGQGEHCCSEE